MENLAITTVLILFLAIPGYLARLAYFSGELSRAVLPRKPLDDIYSSIVFALLIQGAGLAVVEFIYHCLKLELPLVGRIPDIDFLKIYRLFTGKFFECGAISDEACIRKHDSLNWIVEQSYHDGLWIAAYFALLFSLALIGGWGLRKIVWWGELDLKFTVFKFENFWLYRQTGRGFVQDQELRENERLVVVCDVLVENNDPSVQVIFSGFFHTFSTEPNGELRDVILTDVNKWRVYFEPNVRDGELQGTIHQHPEVLAGSMMIIKNSSILNLMISYYAENVNADIDPTTGEVVRYPPRLLRASWKSWDS